MTLRINNTLLFLFASATTFVLLLCSSCSDGITPPDGTPHAVDTTSHDWVFTMYEVGGMNTRLMDVCALSPDYAIAVGSVQGFDWPRKNAYLWDGNALTAISLPIYPNDTVTIDPQHGTRTWVSWMDLNSVWAFRRDNLWYATGPGSGAIAHMTIRGTDTSVRQETWKTRADFIPSPGLSVWAKDTSELYFGVRKGTHYATRMEAGRISPHRRTTAQLSISGVHHPEIF
jgi:hypothetical protein